jgi:hypothetical protein
VFTEVRRHPGSEPLMVRDCWEKTESQSWIWHFLLDFPLKHWRFLTELDERLRNHVELWAESRQLSRAFGHLTIPALKFRFRLPNQLGWGTEFPGRKRSSRDVWQSESVLHLRDALSDDRWRSQLGFWGGYKTVHGASGCALLHSLDSQLGAPKPKGTHYRGESQNSPQLLAKPQTRGLLLRPQTGEKAKAYPGGRHGSVLQTSVPDWNKRVFFCSNCLSEAAFSHKISFTITFTFTVQRLIHNYQIC